MSKLNKWINNKYELGGSPGLVVIGGDSRSNPGAGYWMDMTFFRIDLLFKKLYCLFEKTENK